MGPHLTTLRVYSHMVEGRDREAADFIGALMSASKPGALDEGRPVDAVEPADGEAARDLA